VAAEEETAGVRPETGTGPEFDESNIVELVERMKPRLEDPGIKELVLVLELQTQSLRRANEKIAELLVK
jgi:predicted xylose isomerase-like sugar epimerase